MEYREVSGHQKGGIGEALVTAHRYEMYDVLGEWAVDDLREHEGEEIDSADALKVKREKLDEFQKYYAGNEDEMTWMPDCRYRVIATHEEEITVGDGQRTRMAQRSNTYDYVLEVKVGKHGSLKRDQRDVMEAVEAAENGIIPVRVRVDIERLPDEYGIHLTRIHDRH